MKAVFSLTCSLGRPGTPVPHIWKDRVTGMQGNARLSSGGTGMEAHLGPADRQLQSTLLARLVMSCERNCPHCMSRLLYGLGMARRELSKNIDTARGLGRCWRVESGILSSL